MADTYGFGDGSPRTAVPPGEDAQKTSTSDGEQAAYVAQPLDREFTDNVRGPAPVDGLNMTPDWEKSSIHPSWKDNVSIGSGDTSTLGKWPIQNYGNSPKQMSASGPGPADWTGNHPGSD